MSMCTSGSLSICATAGTNRSIATAVTSTGSGSLSTLSAWAGKSSPHGMREFYGYSPSQNIGVNLTHVSSTSTTNCYTKITKPISVSSNYNICIEFKLSWSGLGSGGSVCLMCNGICKYGCNINVVDCFPLFNIDNTDNVCLCTTAVKGFQGDSWADSYACIHTISTGSGSLDTFYKGSPASQHSDEGPVP